MTARTGLSRQKLREGALDIFWLSCSALLTAVTVNFFFLHTNLAPGGLTGLAIILSAITGLPLEYMTLLVSVPLLLFGFLFVGAHFGLKTIGITLLIPLMIRLVPKFNPLASLPEVAQLILSMLLGGMMIGASIAIALRRNCATGGTDLLAILIRKGIRVGEIHQIVFCCDGLIIILSGFIAKNGMVSVASFLTLLIIIFTLKWLGPKTASEETKKAESSAFSAQRRRSG